MAICPPAFGCFNTTKPTTLSYPSKRLSNHTFRSHAFSSPSDNTFFKIFLNKILVKAAGLCSIPVAENTVVCLIEFFMTSSAVSIWMIGRFDDCSIKHKIIQFSASHYTKIHTDVLFIGKAFH